VRTIIILGLVLLSDLSMASVGELQTVDWDPSGHEKTCVWLFPEYQALYGVILPAGEDCPQTLSDADLPKSELERMKNPGDVGESRHTLAEESNQLMRNCQPGYAEVLLTLGPDGTVTGKKIQTVVPEEYRDLAGWLVDDSDFPPGEPNSEQVAKIEFSNPACQ
jgi:hypothetical protein